MIKCYSNESKDLVSKSWEEIKDLCIVYKQPSKSYLYISRKDLDDLVVTLGTIMSNDNIIFTNSAIVGVYAYDINDGIASYAESDNMLLKELIVDYNKLLNNECIHIVYGIQIDLILQKVIIQAAQYNKLAPMGFRLNTQINMLERKRIIDEFLEDDV